LGLASLSAKLKKQPIEGRDRSVFFSFVACLVSIQQCDRNSPFVQLNQLELAGVEIGTYRAQGIRHTVKIRKLRRVGALRSPGLGQFFNVCQA
jgi:hypothetical protein